MSISHIKRNAAPVTRNEYSILINLHYHLSGTGPLHKNREYLTPRQRLAIASGVSTKVAQTAIRLALRQEEPMQSTIGRPKLVIDEDLGAAIRTFILRNNKAGIPVTAALIRTELQDNHGLVLHPKTLTRYLIRLGLTYGKAELDDTENDEEEDALSEEGFISEED